MDIYTEKSIEKNPVIFDQYDLQVVQIADLAWREGKYRWPESWLSKPQAPDQIVDATINCYQPPLPPSHLNHLLAPLVSLDIVFLPFNATPLPYT